MTRLIDKEWKGRIESILRNRILDITDEYKGIKKNTGVQVYLGYPQELIDELFLSFKQIISQELMNFSKEILEGTYFKPTSEKIKKALEKRNIK